MATGNTRDMGTKAGIDAISLDDGSLIIYDTDNEDAWIQSTAVVGIGDRP